MQLSALAEMAPESPRMQWKEPEMDRACEDELDRHPPPDISVPHVRSEYSLSAIAGFAVIMNAWAVRDEEATGLRWSGTSVENAFDSWISTAALCCAEDLALPLTPPRWSRLSPPLMSGSQLSTLRCISFSNSTPGTPHSSGSGHRTSAPTQLPIKSNKW